jgi:ubiquinone/menaquinone biosynthesis C-methylase UbiE
MSVHEAYNAWAGSYDDDRNLTRDLDRQATSALLGEQRYRAMLELGCGTGKNTALFARLAGAVQALDFSEGMLRQARAKLQHEHVRFEQADLTRPWPCPDASVDLVSANLVLEHIEDLGFIFGEAARCLAPGGQLFVSELHPFKQYLGSKARYQQGETTAEIPAFVHHLSDFLGAAEAHGLSLRSLREWWHAEDTALPPRLLTLLFEKTAQQGVRREA